MIRPGLKFSPDKPSATEKISPRSAADSRDQKEKSLHPRNCHREGYDFLRLIRTSPALAPFVAENAFGNLSVDFANPAAVKALNVALLKADYGVSEWDVPPGYLCPPVPGRADYIHHLADLLAESDRTIIPRGASVRILDLGVGANCIYPIIGVHEYGWHFVGTELDPVALQHARKIVAANASFSKAIECRPQPNASAIFRGVIDAKERFAASICNPPFHLSARAAAAGTQRKLRNLGGGKNPRAILNFGGRPNELWCEGGELAFIRRMIVESAQRPRACGWFTTLVSKLAHLPAIERALIAVGPTDRRVIPMSHGQKQSRIVAWTFSKAFQT